MQDTIFVGIDVSLKSNAVCVLNSQGKKLGSFSVHNDQEGSRELALRVCSCMSKVAAESEIRFGIEATSVYGLPLLYFLKQEPAIAKITPRFYILNPKQVNGFKKTYSDLPKTDPVDAFVIADCLRFGRIGTKEAYMDDFYASLQKLTRARFHVAQDLAAEKNRYFIYGKPIPKATPFYEYAERWYRTRKEPFISLASKASYKSCFIKHLLPAFGLMNLKAIDATQLQEFVNGFSGSSKSQITLVVGTLRSIFSTAYAEGYIERDPSVALIRPKASRKEERRPLTPEETRNVLAVAESHPDGLIVAVLYYLGLRRGEALGLKWGDFDFVEDQVHIERDIDFAGSTA